MATAIPYIAAGLATTAAVGTVASALETNSSIEAKKNAIALESSQEQVSFAQKTLNIVEDTKQKIESQAVAASAGNMSLASPSLKTAQLTAFQRGQTSASNMQNNAATAKISADNEISALDREQDFLPLETIGKIAFDAGTMGSTLGWFKPA